MPLVTTGRNAISALMIGTGVYYDASNAHIGVGDSSTAFNVAQTDLQAATNKHYEPVDSAPTVSGLVETFIATFEAADANFSWQEFGIFNASGGNILVRKVQASITKASPAVVEVTIEVTYALCP